MIYGFALQSGGQVRIQFEVGQGTTVCIDLPQHCGDGERSDDSVRRPDEVPHAAVGETVLVVDDELTDRMLVTEVLNDLGYAALKAEYGRSGLKIASRRHGRTASSRLRSGSAAGPEGAFHHQPCREGRIK